MFIGQLMHMISGSVAIYWNSSNKLLRHFLLLVLFTSIRELFSFNQKFLNYIIVYNFELHALHYGNY